MMRMVDVIDHKRNGGTLTAEEIQFFLSAELLMVASRTTRPVRC